MEISHRRKKHQPRIRSTQHTERLDRNAISGAVPDVAVVRLVHDAAFDRGLNTLLSITSTSADCGLVLVTKLNLAKVLSDKLLLTGERTNDEREEVKFFMHFVFSVSRDILYTLRNNLRNTFTFIR